MSIETILSIFLGIGLASSVGFRVFLPLFALSLAAYFNLWQLNDSWGWLASLPALVALGVATVFEICAYFIPWFDNILDTIAIPLATLAGTAVMASTAIDLSPVFTWGLAIIAGGGTAAAVKTTASATRLASTATTAGVANPVVAGAETGASVVMATASLIAPVVGVILVVFLFGLTTFFYKKIIKKKK